MAERSWPYSPDSPQPPVLFEGTTAAWRLCAAEQVLPAAGMHRVVAENLWETPVACGRIFKSVQGKKDVKALIYTFLRSNILQLLSFSVNTIGFILYNERDWAASMIKMFLFSFFNFMNCYCRKCKTQFLKSFYCEVILQIGKKARFWFCLCIPLLQCSQCSHLGLSLPPLRV